MTWTTYADVTARWVGNDAPTSEALVDALIADAEAVILAEYPGIQTRIDSGALPLNVVKMVTVRMVSRVLRNPESLTYIQQTTGPFGQARNYGSGGQDIWLTSDEEEMLSPKRNGKAFEIDLGANAAIIPIVGWTEHTPGSVIMNDWDED